jgi:hypothetical protein
VNRRSVGFLRQFSKRAIANGLDLSSHPVVLQYVVRSLRMQKHHHIKTLQFFLPQFVQLLRQDSYGIIGDFIGELAVSSTLLCHQLIWLLQLESVDENHAASLEDAPRHGYCRSLLGKDPLPGRALEALTKTRNLLTPFQREYLDRECEFFNSVTNISAKLKQVKDKEKHNQLIKESLIDLGFHPNLYLPTDPFKAVTEVVVESGIPMQSAAKCPYLLVFHTAPWGGPDSMSADSSDILKPSESPENSRVNTISIRKSQKILLSPPPRKFGIGKMDSHSFTSPKIMRRMRSTREDDSSSSNELLEPGDLSTTSSNLDLIDGDVSLADRHFDLLISSSDRTEESKTDPMEKQVLGDGNRGGGAPMALSGESNLTSKFKSWGQWKDFRLSRPHQRKAAPFRATVLVGKHTPYPSHTSTASSGKEACIFKVYDDCRQDALTIQVLPSFSFSH